MEEAEAIEIARTYAEHSDWPWLEPVNCIECDDPLNGEVFVVKTNYGGRGCNITIKIAISSGKVVKALFHPR